MDLHVSSELMSMQTPCLRQKQIRSMWELSICKQPQLNLAKCHHVISLRQACPEP